MMLTKRDCARLGDAVKAAGLTVDEALKLLAQPMVKPPVARRTTPKRVRT